MFLFFLALAAKATAKQSGRKNNGDRRNFPLNLQCMVDTVNTVVWDMEYALGGYDRWRHGRLWYTVWNISDNLDNFVDTVDSLVYNIQ